MPPKKVRPPIVLRIPEPKPDIDNWIVLGLDPSVSRTGFSVMGVWVQDDKLETKWLGCGSAKPDKVEDRRHPRTTLWARSKAISLYLREYLKLFPISSKRTGLIISMEYPTPQNDYLVGLNRILHVIMFEDEVLSNTFGSIQILTPNASTLRSLMGLKQRGASNKKENIEKAYTFIDIKEYPQLDTDSCDAILMGMMGRYLASILMGRTQDVPPTFLTRMCDSTEELKGKGKRQYIKIRGVLHIPEYWYEYVRQDYGLGIKDATNPKKSLTYKYFRL